MFFICLVAIEYLATKAPSSIEIPTFSWDKLNHFIAFFVLYVLLSWGYKNLSTKRKFLLLLIFAIQIEFVQYFLTSREASFLDLIADFIGIVVAYYYVYLKKNSIQLEFMNYKKENYGKFFEKIKRG